MNISLPFYPEGRGAERLASYWPDGSLKHRWRTLFATRTVVCDWCGNTRGVATSGKLNVVLGEKGLADRVINLL